MTTNAAEVSSVRDDLQKAMAAETPTETAADNTPAPEQAPVQEPEQEQAAEAPETPEAAPEGEQPEGEAGEQQAGEQQEKPEKSREYLKAPASWKPAAREGWRSVPHSIREEIHRRERHMGQVMQESATARQVAQAFYSTVEPYRAMMEAENTNPVQAVGQLLKTAAALRIAPAAQKAKLVADMIKHFGVDVVQLDSALAGVIPQANPEADKLRAEMRQQMAPVQQMQQQMYQAQQNIRQQNQMEAIGELTEFAQSHEFVPELRFAMADALEIAQRQGMDMTVEQAYRHAASMHPEISKILGQRAAQAAKAAAAKAAAAGVSTGGGSPLPSGRVNSGARGESGPRSDIEAAIQKLSNR